jgi:hypothetical protein
MFMDLCSDVISIVKHWTPEKKYSRETGYRDDLMEFLRRELKRPQLPFLEAPTHRIKKEAGRSRADIEIDRKIGLELKRNLKGKTEMDRVYGQLDEYAKEYESVIVVLCGEVKDETVEELEHRVKQLDSGWATVLDGPKVTVVRKDEATLKKEKKKTRKRKKDDDWSFL